MYFPLFGGVLCLSLFNCVLLCVISSFAIILKRKREMVALLYCLTDFLLPCMYVTLPHGLVC